MSEISDFINYKAELVELLQNVTRGLVENLELEFEPEGEQWRIKLNSEDNGILIGHQGENLLAIQHIIRILFHARHPENRTHFVIDVGAYRTARERFITNMVREMVYKEVLQDGSTIIIKGLNSYERRLVHNSLGDYKGMESSSIGEDNNRRMIIRPTTGSATRGIEDAKVIDIEKYEKEFREKNKKPETEEISQV
jgi:spoIIIJ-associated protein